jgi:SSS family solute:Na+ symporter
VVTLAPVDLLLIAAYFAAVLLVGFLSSRKNSESAQYLLAGRSLTLPLFVMTLVSTWYGGILGVGEFSYLYGISNWFIQGAPYYLFALVFALLLAKRIRRTNFITIPDKLHEAYGKPAALLGAFLTFLLMTPAPYVLMLAVLLELVTGWGILTCLLVGTVATTAYLFTGGFRSDVYTDVLEFFLMFGGFAVILPYAFSTYGGMEFLKSHLPPLHLVWHGGNPPQFILVWFLIALWTLVDPSFHQRCYAAKSPVVAQKGILWSILFWFIFDAMTASAGLYARAALPALAQPVMAYPLLAERVLPEGAKGLFYVGMLATIMSTLNTLSFVSATTLGRDIICRAKGWHDGAREKSLVRWGLVATGLLSIALAYAIPSVVRLWYVIGSSVVPGLLVPLVTSYFEQWKAPPRAAFFSMLAGWGTSSIWLIWGWTERLGSVARYPLGVEPMIPGLVVSSLVWWVGWRVVRR